MLLPRPAVVVSPLGEGALLFLSMNGREVLGRPFTYELDLLAADERVDLSALLGQTMTVGLELATGEIRQFNGYVTEFGLVGEVGRRVRYRARLRPWLWLLIHTRNSRIFQNLSAPEVLKQIFREHGFTDFEELLSLEYRSWEYLVQYRESDFNFVSRLMEQEGIYYYFKHHDGKHTLVLADSYSAHERTSGFGSVPYFPPQAGEQRERDHIDSWRASRRIRPGAFVVADFDFERPQAKLLSQLRMPAEHTLADAEVYDYPGEFRVTEEGDHQARIRLEEQQFDHETVHGAGNVRGLRSGGLFELTDFPREDQNKEYLIVDAAYELNVDDYASVDSGAETVTFRCQFSAIDSKHPFRTPRTTRKPVVEGPQTAIVVGQQNQEIWTDEYGRVKVQFHWDRLGQLDENSSCWVRVSQPWAGTGFGGIFIPRIGQEVIVDFLEGDPDRPIITGRVYNADNMPPYGLPGNQTQSGFKSRSTKGGLPDNFNEIRFEDKKGEEELYVQAEKNQTILVKNDQSTSVKMNRSASVGGSDSVSVTGDRSVSVHGNLSVKVDGTGKSPVHSTMNVTGKHSMDATDTIEVQAPTHIKLTVGGSSIMITPGAITITAGGGASITLDASALAKSKPGTEMKLDANAFTKASTGASVLLDANVKAESQAGHSLLIDAGKAKVTAGASSIEATTSAINIASTTITADGSGSGVQLAAAGATMSGPKATVSGSGTTEITGALVKIN